MKTRRGSFAAEGFIRFFCNCIQPYIHLAIKFHPQWSVYLSCFYDPNTDKRVDRLYCINMTIVFHCAGKLSFKRIVWVMISHSYVEYSSLISLRAGFQRILALFEVNLVIIRFSEAKPSSYSKLHFYIGAILNDYVRFGYRAILLTHRCTELISLPPSVYRCELFWGKV